MKTFRSLIITLLIFPIASIVCSGQYLSGYPNAINNLDLSKTPVTKTDVIAALGEPTQYEIHEYPDEQFVGTDEFYKYVSNNKELYMMFTDGIVQEFYTDSSDYLFYGTIRVGDNIKNFRDMIANGFGKFFIEEDRGPNLKTVVVKLGDNTLRVTHNNSVITFIMYQALF